MGTGAGEKGRWRPWDNGERRQILAICFAKGEWGGERGEGRKGRAADDIFQLKKNFFSAPHSGERGNLGDLILALKY